MNSLILLVIVAITCGANAQYGSYMTQNIGGQVPQSKIVRPQASSGYGQAPMSAPSSSYGSQAPRFTAPVSSYGSEAPRAPVPMSAPSSSYGSQAPRFTAPVSSYGSEAPRAPVPMAAPSSSYGSQAPRFTAPVSSYGSQAPQSAPVSSYGSQAPRAEVASFNPCTEEVMRAAEILLFANPSDQSSYLICTDVDVFVSMPCSPGTVFDSTQRHCLPIGYEAPVCPVGTCQNQADCILDESNAFRCLCRIGFTGQACEINIDECATEGNNACSTYNGQCVDQVNGYYCQWGNEIGLIYENRISNPCSLDNLSNDKQFFQLISVGQNVFLQCTGEMTFVVSRCAELLYWHQELRTCSIEPALPKTGVCNTYPCRNDGECIDLGGSNFQCSCKPGFNGALCESAIDFCANYPCQNGGRCVSHTTGYNCICSNNVVDDSCATGVSNPCPLGSRDYYPNNFNSNKYFVCSVDGLAFSRDCAPGLVWSQDVLTCVYAVEPVAPQHIKPQLSIPMTQSYGQSSYGQQQQQALPQSRPTMQQSSYGQQQQVLPQSRPTMQQSSYGQQQQQVLPQSRPTLQQSSYGQQQETFAPAPMTQAPAQSSYGQQQQQVLPQSRPTMQQSSYGQQETVAPAPMTQAPAQSSYGQQQETVAPAPMTQAPAQSSYGQQQQQVLPQSRPTMQQSSYGQQKQIVAPQIRPTLQQSSYGQQQEIVAPAPMTQAPSSYGQNVPQLAQSYGQQVIPQNKPLTKPAYGDRLLSYFRG